MPLPNARDLGGLPAAGGRRVRPGVVFRGAAPNSDDHAQTLTSWGVQRSIDLRTAAEREIRPARLPSTATLVTADLLADEPEAGPATLGSIARAAVTGDTHNLTPAHLDEIFVAGYRSFVTLDSARRATAVALTTAAAGDPVLIHCTAGKDRTGWVVAALLTTLEVPWDVVMKDYLLSGPEVLALFAPYRERVAAQGGDVAAMERALAVFPHYLEAAREEALARFGSWDGYLRDGLGLDQELPARLRAGLLEGD